jgi:hypothetical protein
MKNFGADIKLGRMLVVITIIALLISLLPGCYIYEGTYSSNSINEDEYIYQNKTIYYWSDNVYTGYYQGFYYYYGMPHYYNWTYYYNTCPPSHHSHATHIVINRPVHTSTHRPNRPRGNDNTRIYIKPNKNHSTTPNRNTTKVKTNRSNTKVKTNRSIKVNRSSNKNKPK